MIGRLRGLAGVVVISVLVAALACCGSRRDELEKLSAPKLLAEAHKAALDADAMTLSGDAGEVKIKLGYTGAKVSGTMTVKGGKLEILRTGGTTYFRASDAYWRATVADDAARVIALVRGRWVRVDPKDENFEDYATLASRTKILDEFLDKDLELAAAEPRKIDGVECLALSLGENTFYLAADDARPTRLVDAGSSGDASTLDFAYGEVSVPAKPANEDVMESAELLG